MSKYSVLLANIIRSESFASENFGKYALHVVGEINRFIDLFGWQQLNNVLNSSPQPHPGVKMSHRGAQFKPQTGTGLIQAVQDGATLILENIDRYDQTLGRFLSTFSEFLDEETRLNMYLSYPENQGYGIHYDTHDFFILQISGYKKWFIFPETTRSVLFDQKCHDTEPPEEDKAYMQCVLRPGDVLYVPRGHWHYAVAQKEASMHLTLAMFAKTGIDLLKWIADELTESESFRRSFPPTFMTGTNAADHLGLLHRELVCFLEREDLYERFLEYKRVTNRDRAPFQFPDHTDISLNICENAKYFERRSQVASISARDPNEIRLACSGRLTVFEGKAESVLRYIFSQTTFTKQGLVAIEPNMPWRSIATIILRLVKEGYCRVVE